MVITDRPIEINSFLPPKSTPKIHHPIFPNDIRMVISGPSGCGKTNLTMHLVKNYIKWEHLYIITMTPDQEIFDWLRDRNDVTFCPIDYKGPFSANCLVIFDDFMLVKDQKLAGELFSMGRHNKYNCIYIAQKFSEINLVVRNNANVIILFKCDNTSKECVYNMYLYGDMDIDEFKSIQLRGRDFLVIRPGYDLLMNFKPYKISTGKKIFLPEWTFPIREKKEKDKRKSKLRSFYKWFIDTVVN